MLGHELLGKVAFLVGDTGIDYPAFAEQCYRVLHNNSHAYFFTRYDKYPYHYECLTKAGFMIKNCLVIETVRNRRLVVKVVNLYFQISGLFLSSRKDTAAFFIFCPLDKSALSDYTVYAIHNTVRR